MYLVLVLHVNSLVIGIPSRADCLNEPTSTCFRLFTQCLAIVAVNIFVLISGWFGIKPSLKKLCSLLFQVFFFTLSFLIIHCLFHGLNSVSGDSILKSFMITKCYWFVKSYICLFLLSPVLNLFVEKASKRIYQLVLIGFFVFQTIYGWTDSAPEFQYGYSVVSFTGLYLLARYLRIYPLKIVPRRIVCLISYLFLSVLLALAAFLLIRTDFHTEHAIPVTFSYINPIVILSSVSLLFVFTQTEIRYSKTINWIAASAFSVYIIHINGFIFHYFRDAVWHIYSTYPTGLRWLLILCYLLLVFISCVFLDKIRLFVWKRIERTFSNK